MTDNAALTQTCMQSPLPSRSCHPPSYAEYMEGEWRAKRCGGISFYCENDQKLTESHPTSHYGLWFSFHPRDHTVKKIYRFAPSRAVRTEED